MVYLNIERTEEPDILLKFKTLAEATEYVIVELDVAEDFNISTTPVNYEEKDYILVEPVPKDERIN